MSAAGPAVHAESIADVLRQRLPAPWELFLERTRRFEVHLNGERVEMRRGPIELVGLGLRVFRPAGGRMGVGTFATSDVSPKGVAEAIARAEAVAPLAPSPATALSLPTGRVPVEDLGIRDPAVWDRTEETIGAYAHELLEGVVGRSTVVPSFGSVRAVLSEMSMVNSAGGSLAYAHGTVDMEFAVKAFGGPEGRPPGEFWVNRRMRSVPTRGVAEEVRSWGKRAEDVRGAALTPPGLRRVLLRPETLAEILPDILGYRFSGLAEVRKIAPSPGDAVAAPALTFADDGRLAGAIGTAPGDDEGVPQRRTVLVENGRYVGGIQDVVYGAALGKPSTGNGLREFASRPAGSRFQSNPHPETTTLVVAPGTGGDESELLEQMGDGILIDQLGYAFPDGLSTSFGGEVRLGYRVRGGKKAEPLRGGTVGGFCLAPSETPALLSSVIGLGSHPSLCNRILAPPMLFEGFPIAGA